MAFSIWYATLLMQSLGMVENSLKIIKLLSLQVYCTFYKNPCSYKSFFSTTSVPVLQKTLASEMSNIWQNNFVVQKSVTQMLKKVDPDPSQPNYFWLFFNLDPWHGNKNVFFSFCKKLYAQNIKNNKLLFPIRLFKFFL